MVHETNGLQKKGIFTHSSKEKDRNATSSSGEKTRPKDVDVRIPLESLDRT